MDLNTVEISEYVQATENTRRLKDCAVTSVASLSGMPYMLCQFLKIHVTIH